MADFRFEAGAHVMCNLGPDGWKLGRIIALHYREAHWPPGMVAPYQVMLEADHTLIYVPEDDAGYCREATLEDLRISRRMDALAALPNDAQSHNDAVVAGAHVGGELRCSDRPAQPGDAYRHGQCQCCHRCPRDWSYVELYSEHYRCAARNRLAVTRVSVDLGTLRVGQSIQHQVVEGSAPKDGYAQAPTLVRLPPGLEFSDDGILSGKVAFDPHRESTYTVEFVAVSAADWRDPAIGLVRLEVRFVVDGNAPPSGFDRPAFEREQQQARKRAERILDNLCNAWIRWERGELSNRGTCDQMYAELRHLRDLLEIHPRLDGGKWWARLGGFHMNVHKLLENALFECELYLGYALTFGDAEVRRMAEQNLDGCYQKRLLEAARFMWNDGLRQMMEGQWEAAAETLRQAAGKKDGWGWAVNYGDIWLSEASARIVQGVAREAHDPEDRDADAPDWLSRAERLLEKTASRADESGVFGREGHPWLSEVRQALIAYRALQSRGADVTEWLDTFKVRTVYWCAQVLSGTPPFPPKLKPRLADAQTLMRRLPHNRGVRA